MIFLLVLAIALSALLSGSETSLFSLSPLTIKTYRTSINARRRLIAQMMEKPRDVLVTILMLNVLANVLVQNFTSTIFDPFPGWALKVAVPLVITLLFGELLPKSFALPYHVAVSDRVAPLIYAVTWALRPIRQPLTQATNFISRLFFPFLKEESEVSPEELRHVLKTSQEGGVLLPIESELMGGALDLQLSVVREHMRPREEIVFYDIQDPIAELVHQFVDLETTRLPVCNGSLENLKGILSARQYFFHKEHVRQGEDLLAILKRPYFIPESMNSWTLLRNLRERGENMAIVVDEYGSISGLITQEDLIEGVVGEIADRRDAQSLFTRSSEDVIIASGKFELSEFKEVFGVPLQTKEGIVTLGGWLIEQLGDIPATGTKYATDDFLFYVLAADPNRVKRVYVRRLKR